MEKSLAIKIISILFYVLFGVSIVFAVIFATDTLGKGDLLLKWTYVLTVAAIGSVAVFMVLSMFKSKKSIIMSVAAIVGAAVLVLISYGLASDVVPLNAAGELMEITPEGSKWSGALLYGLYILLGASFVSLLYTEISKAFK